MAFSFNEATGSKARKTIVIDALNLAFRWKHQGRTDFRDDYVQTVKSLAPSFNSRRCTHVVWFYQ